MRRTEQKDHARVNWRGSRYRRAPGGVRALLLLLALASLAAFAVACGDDPAPTPVPIATAAPDPTATSMPEPTQAPVPTAAPEPTPAPAAMDDEMDDEEVTRAYVTKAIDYYGENGLDATVERYRSQAGTEDGRTLLLLDQDEGELLVYRNIPALEGQYVGPGSRYSAFTELIETATEEGFWATTRGVNPLTKQEEPRRVLVVLHDGLVFSASHSVLVEDVGDSVKGYVDKAIAKYQDEGLDAAHRPLQQPGQPGRTVLPVPHRRG